MGQGTDLKRSAAGIERAVAMTVISLLTSLTMGCVTTPQDDVLVKGAEGERRYETIQQAEAEADDDDLICRREDVMGTHFPRTVCMTTAQRRHAREEAQKQLQRSRSPARGQLMADSTGVCSRSW